MSVIVGPTVTTISIVPGMKGGQFSLTGRTEFGNGTAKGFSLRNITIPYAEAGDPKELSCATPSVTIGNPAFQNGVLFKWTGPNGYTSSVKNPVVTVPGTYVLTVTSGSCTITDEVEVTSTITPGQACAPVMKPVPNRNLVEMVALTLPAATFDATDGDTPAGNLVYTMEDLPTGAAFNSSTKTFTWTPTEEQGPGVYLLTARVSDGTSDDTVQFKINVTEANRPPVVDQPAPQIVAVGQELTFTATATDPDLPAQQLFFSLSNYSSTQVVPPGATVTPEGHFSWTPTNATVGRFNFNMGVRDERNAGHIKVFNTTVNAAPVLNPIGNKTAAVGEALVFALSGSDINNEGQGSQPMKQARVFSLIDAPTDKGPISVTTSPGGDYTGAENVFTRSTSNINGFFSWTPSETGTYKFKIRLADNGAVPQYDEEEITIVVSDAYTLTITPPTNGTISANPAPDQNGKYTSGTVVTLTATAADGFRFVGWTGDAEGSETPLQLTMDASKTVSATFEPIPSYTLTITEPSNGTISTNPAPNEDGKYRDGTNVILTATPEAGYRFVGWGGAVSGNSVTTVVTMDGDKTVSATFEIIPPTMYSLTLTQPQNGSIAAEPSAATHVAGTVVTLTATAEDGYRFTGWTGDASGTTNPLQLSMNSDKTISATFELIPTYTLTITEPSNGTVTADPAPDQAGIYREGTVVTLTAIPADGFLFSGWSGDASGSELTATVTMNGNRTVTATFEALPPTMYTLTLNQPENGSISHEPAGDTYEAGTVVTLTANSSPGFRFSGWTGDATGTTNPLALTMNGNKTVSATFEAIPTYTLTITNPDNGSGTISYTPEADQDGKYTEGTQVTLTAIPAAGYQFTGWMGAASGIVNPLQLVMDADKNVSATFELIPPTTYTLTLNDPENGSIEADPEAVTYVAGTEVTLRAIPDDGFRFTGWSGDASGTDLTTSVTMNADKTVSATFEPIPTYTLTITEPINGTIGINPTADQDGKYSEGTVVTLVAIPASGYRFVNWSSDASGSESTVMVTMDADKTVSANFEVIPPTMYALTLNQPENGSISAAPSAATYVAGTVVTLTATPADGYQFVGWTGDASGSELTVSITMDADKAVSATFEVIPPTMYALTLNQPENGTISADPSAPSYEAGTVVTLTATPASGYRFTGWTGDASGNVLTATVTMDADKQVSATFELIPPTMYALTITQPANGSITAQPAAATYVAGTVVTLTATPADGFRFVSWGGAATGTEPNTTVTMDQDKTVSATIEALPTGPLVTSFTLVNSHTEQDHFQLENGAVIALSELSSTKLNIRANTAPGTVGSVKLELSGTQSRTYTDNAAPYALHGDDGRGNYYFGNWNPPATGTYTLTATPYAGANGTGAAGTPLTISFNVVDQPETPTDRYNLTLTTIGSGTVSRNPEQSTYTAGTVVTLTATPAAGFQFAGWSGNASGSQNPLQLTMDGNKSVTATFTASTTQQQVTSFTLVNSHTEQDHFQLENGAVIALSELSSTKLNIRANTAPGTV
ncbi:InlB B-repeat-containing protein, partial [Pontibacter sp. HSC-14F20]|uniref:InlB B-repeat-containing protein n=1 Tax=Pontibacter sp. HSC-14F20 TaxID=2864136 RepID=UPI001C739741